MTRSIFLFIVLFTSSCISDSARPYNEFTKEYQNLPDADLEDLRDLGSDLVSDVVPDVVLPVIEQICSDAPGDFVRLRFFNKTGVNGKVSRVKSDCTEEFVLDLNTGDDPFQDSFVGEVWSFRDLKGDELTRFRIADTLKIRIDFEVQECKHASS